MLKYRLCSLLATLAVAFAAFGAGSASGNGFGQPKEPANLKQMLKK